MYNEHKYISYENQKWYKNTYKYSRRGKTYYNTSKFPEISQRVPAGTHENRSNFPWQLSQNFVRMHTNVPGDHTPRTDILQNLPRQMISQPARDVRTTLLRCRFNVFDVVITSCAGWVRCQCDPLAHLLVYEQRRETRY